MLHTYCTMFFSLSLLLQNLLQLISALCFPYPCARSLSEAVFFVMLCSSAKQKDRYCPGLCCNTACPLRLLVGEIIVTIQDLCGHQVTTGSIVIIFLPVSKTGEQKVKYSWPMAETANVILSFC